MQEPTMGDNPKLKKNGSKSEPTVGGNLNKRKNNLKSGGEKMLKTSIESKKRRQIIKNEGYPTDIESSRSICRWKIKKPYDLQYE